MISFFYVSFVETIVFYHRSGGGTINCVRNIIKLDLDLNKKFYVFLDVFKFFLFV